jgi:hypothetical protein
LLSGVIGGFGGPLGRDPSRRINDCARPGCIPIIGLLSSGFRAPRNPGCLETAYPTIQYGIGQTETPRASTIVGPEPSVAASGIVEPEALNVSASTIVGSELNVTLVEPELNVAVSTIVDPERAGAAFSRHGDLPSDRPVPHPPNSGPHH